MSFDLGEVLTRSWKISWNYKVLWMFGIGISLLVLLLLPLMFIPAVVNSIMDQRVDDTTAFVFLVAGSILFLIVIFPVGTLLNASLAVGVLRAERDADKPTFADLIRESFPFFWRFLWTAALFTGGMLFVGLLFGIFFMLFSVVTLGVGMICMLPLSFLQYPLVLIWYVWLEQSLAAIVVDNMNVMDSIRHCWQLLKKNILALTLMGLVMYFGVMTLSSFVMLPIMFPFFILPFAFESAEFGRVLLIIGGVCSVVFVPVFLIFQGGVTAFMKSGWVLTYLRLTRNAGHLPELQSTEA